MSLLFFQRPPTATAKPRKCAHVSQNLLKNLKRGLKQLLGPKKKEKKVFLDGVQLKQADLVPKTPQKMENDLEVPCCPPNLSSKSQAAK